MTPSLLMAVLASGFIYGITPGPGVLAVFGIGAAHGRRAGAGFLCGHLLGDVVWCSTALIAIVRITARRSSSERSRSVSIAVSPACSAIARRMAR